MENAVAEQNAEVTGLPWWGAFPLVCGVLIRLRSALFRVYKRSECRIHRDLDLQPQQMYGLVRIVVHEREALSGWSPESLWAIAEELTTKSLNLSLPLNKELQAHPIYPLVDGKMAFHADFLLRVRDYHHSLQRPEGTFSVDTEKAAELDALCDIPRTRCPRCGGRRQLYCGPCGGLRMPSAAALLPDPVPLPFDILLVVHWNESLMKCTGIHAGALAAGGVQHRQWRKAPAPVPATDTIPHADTIPKSDTAPHDNVDGAEEGIWTDIVDGLNADRDVLLFPYDDALPAEHFPWGADEQTRRRRLVVLEGSWGYAKAMAQLIPARRRQQGMAAVPSVRLSDIVGQYWRFHSEGHSAVSTIEAIAHTAVAAGCAVEAADALLGLFRVQRHRVMRSTAAGAKLPRAMDVTGVGLGCWRDDSVHSLTN